MVRGMLTGFYPYPFINVSKLGLFSVLLNAIGVLVAYFVILALLLVVKKTPMRSVPPTHAQLVHRPE
jgi:hypothetical protein